MDRNNEVMQSVKRVVIKVGTSTIAPPQWSHQYLPHGASGQDHIRFKKPRL